MLVEILEQLQTDKVQFSWYQDAYYNFDDEQLPRQLARFNTFNQTHQLRRLVDFDNIANLSKLPTPEQVRRYPALKKYSTIDECDLIKLNADDLDTFAEQLNKIRDIKIDYTQEQDWRVLKSQANTLLEYLNNGGKLQGLGFCEKRRLPKNIREIAGFVKEVKINNSPCDTQEEFNQVITDLMVRETCNSLARAPDIEALLKDVEGTKLNQKWRSLDATIGDAKDYLLSLDSPYKPYKNIDFTDPQNYEQYYKKVEALNIFKDLQQQLSQKIPNTIKQILAGESINFEQLKNALYFKHAQNYADQLPPEDSLTLKNRIKQKRSEQKQLITKIGANKAWQGVINNIDDSLKTELKHWEQAISKISNTNSKRTRKYRKLAKQKMQVCKDVIPCWIMPLQQLVDTITPKQGMYDYIIIDEASQLGIDALLLLYLAKKIIIVGDEKQIAPENIGRDKGEVENAIKKYLNDIPNKEFYDTEGSLFDLASNNFHAHITLREHFRCMPEIIGFSNKLCYADTPLYPLRTYSEKRLEPLESVFCNNGDIEGEESNIINKPEAEAIVAKITQIIEDEDYQKKTIGVITLQGNAQKEVIHNLLLEKIDEKAYTARKIIVGEPASFQGDERDIIFLSLVTAHNHKRNALTIPAAKRRFNVAASRAKDQLWLFHSVQLDNLKNHNDLRYKLLEYITSYTPETFAQRELIPVPKPKPRYGDEPKSPEPFRSWFEVEVYNDVLTKGYQVIPAYKVAGYEIDLVPLCTDGTKLAVECDGDYWHGDAEYDKDRERQDVLERAGWEFFRIRYSDYRRDKDLAMQGLWESLEKHLSKPTKIANKAEDSPIIDNAATEQASPQAEAEKDHEARIATVINPSSISATEALSQEPRILGFFNLYKSGRYILSQNKKDDADFVLEIKEQYKNGYLLQCYNNGHVNKTKVSALFTKRQDKEYKNGFNISTNIPKLFLLEKDEIIGIRFNELSRVKFKAHLTSNLPEKSNLSIQGYKVIYNANFSHPEYRIVPLEKENDIKRLVFASFNAGGKEFNNNNYQEEWDTLESMLQPELNE